MGKLKKRKDGYYCAWYKGKQFLGKTAAEAEQKRDNYKYECEHGIEQVEQISVFDYSEKWLPVAKAGVSATTYNQYATCQLVYFSRRAQVTRMSIIFLPFFIYNFFLKKFYHKGAKLT